MKPKNQNQNKPNTDTTPGLGIGLPSDATPGEIVSEMRELDQQLDAEALMPNFLKPAAVNVPPPPASAVNVSPATTADIQDNRRTYPTKSGGTVTSIAKADLKNRTAQNAVFVVCPTHHVSCIDPKSEGIFTRYYCPVKDCRYSHKLVKPTVAEKINARRKRDDQTPNPQTDITPR